MVPPKSSIRLLEGCNAIQPTIVSRPPRWVVLPISTFCPNTTWGTRVLALVMVWPALEARVAVEEQPAAIKHTDLPTHAAVEAALQIQVTPLGKQGCAGFLNEGPGRGRPDFVIASDGAAVLEVVDKKSSVRRPCH